MTVFPSSVRVIVATGVLPGVGDGLALVQAVAVGVVVVAVLDIPTAIDDFEDGAEIVRQVVVYASGCALTD